MSDVSEGPGWWQASDGRWYPPESHPSYRPPPPYVGGQPTRAPQAARPGRKVWPWVIAAAVVFLVVVTIIGALVGSGDDEKVVAVDPRPTTTAEAVASSMTSPLRTTIPVTTATPATEPPTTATPAATTPVTSPPSLMPNVMCMNLQAAQDLIQTTGVFFSRSNDASGQGRMQVIDSNWIVVGQQPPTGTPIGEGDAVLDVVKIGEPNPC